MERHFTYWPPTNDAPCFKCDHYHMMLGGHELSDGSRSKADRCYPLEHGGDKRPLHNAWVHGDPCCYFKPDTED